MGSASAQRQPPAAAAGGGGGGGVPLLGPGIAAALAAAFAALALVPSLQGPEVMVDAPARTNLQTPRTGPLDAPGFVMAQLVGAGLGGLIHRALGPRPAG